ncbi:hypothetical protein WA171_001525 [Blastocystis sp. BT1]
MTEDNQTLSVDSFNPFIFQQLNKSFESDGYRMDMTTNQSEGMRIEFQKQKESDAVDMMIRVSCWKDIEDCGVEEYIRSKLGNVVVPTEAKNTHVTLHITKADYEKGGIEYLKQVACIHQYVLAAPFHKYLSALGSGTQASLKPKIVSFYPTEPIYIVPSASTISVVFSICENDDTDRALMQVFLLEFSEAKRTVPGCPSVSFSRDDPAEIRDIRIGDKPSAGYLVFSFSEGHVANGRLDSVCEMMCDFRYFLDYHIKSSKSYLHGRMRNRADQWKNLMQEAKFESEGVQKTKASGKTFVK